MLNIVQIRLHRRGHLLGKAVQHIFNLMHPTALMLCIWKRLIQCVPEPHCTVTDRDLGGDGQATRLDISEQFMPTLRAFSKADLKANQFFLTLWCSAYDHQHALCILFHPRLHGARYLELRLLLENNMLSDERNRYGNYLYAA